MNRYKTGGPSKASATTLCQKCLKRGHYSYECTASKDDRPYVSRPSRTQQLMNPKLAPKLSEVLLPEPKSTPKAISISGTSGSALRDTPRSRKGSIDLDGPPTSGRRRSFSSHSSNSVSTISTNRSTSRSRSRSRSPAGRYARMKYSASPDRDGQNDRERSAKGLRGSRNGRRTDKTSARARSRSPARDHRSSRDHQTHRQRSYSPDQSHQALPPSTGHRCSLNAGTEHTVTSQSTARERSLSPYSQRIALTTARNQT